MFTTTDELLHAIDSVASPDSGAARNRLISSSCWRRTKRSRRCLTALPASQMAVAGIQTTNSSLAMTARPPPEKNRRIEIGDTTMGRHGKKNRSAEKGAKKATPKPPLVSASRRPCDTVARNRKK
jgi:hypothetical protein